MGFWFLVETIPTDGNPNRGRKMFLKKVFPQPVSEPAFEHRHWLALSSGFPNNWQKLFWGKVLGVSQRDHCVRNSSSSTHLSAEFRTAKNVNKWTQVAPSRRTSPSTPPLVGGRWRMSDRHGVLMEQQEAGLVNTLASALGDSLARLLTACVF